jgi:hypothetical protein
MPACLPAVKSPSTGSVLRFWMASRAPRPQRVRSGHADFLAMVRSGHADFLARVPRAAALRGPSSEDHTLLMMLAPP